MRKPLYEGERFRVSVDPDADGARCAVIGPGDVVCAEGSVRRETIEVTRTHRLEALRRLADIMASRIADTIELMERPIEVSGDGA